MSGTTGTNIESLRLDGDSSGLVSANKAATASTAELADQLERTDARFTKTSAGVDQFTKKMDVYTAQQQKTELAVQKVAVAEKLLEEARVKGSASVEALTRASTQAQIIRDAELVKLNAMTAAVKDGATQADLMSMANKRIGVSATEAGVSINSGLTREFIVLGHEIVAGNYNRIPGSLIVLAERSGNLAGIVKGMASAFVSVGGLATVALAAVATGFLAATAHAGTMEQQTRTLTVSIQAMGRSAELSAASLTKYVTALQQGGLNRADSNSVLNALVRSPNGLTNSQVGLIAGAAGDLGAALGTTQEKAALDLANGFTNVSEAVKKFDDALNILTPDQRAAVDEMVRHNDKAGALVALYGPLLDRVKGLHEQGLTPMQTAMHDLNTAWDEFITRIGNSKIVTAAMQGIANTIRDPTIDELNVSLTALQKQKDALANQTGFQFGPSGTMGGDVSDVRAQLDKQIADIQSQLNTKLGGSQADRDAILAQRSADQQARDQKALNEKAASIHEAESIPGGTAKDLQATFDQLTAGLAKLGPRVENNSVLWDHYAGALNLVKMGLDKVTGATALQDEITAAAQKGEGDIAKVTAKLAAYKEHLAELGPVSDNNRNDFNNTTAAIKNTAEELARLQKRYGDHITSIQIMDEKINAQIDAQRALGAAYLQGGDAVENILAKEKAREQLASEKILPGEARYQTMLTARTQKLKELAQQTALTDTDKQIKEANNLADATNNIAKAYDGTTLSLTHAQNYQKAYADVLKNGKGDIQGQQEAIDRLTASLDAGTAANKRLAQEQSSIQELSGAFVSAFDTIGNAISQAFVSGQGAAVNWGNVMKAVIGQVIQQLVKLAVINPILNSLFGQNNGTLGTAISVLGQSGGGTAGGTAGTVGGSSGLLGLGNNIFSAGKGIYNLFNNGFGISGGTANTGFGFVDNILNTTLFTTSADASGVGLTGLDAGLGSIANSEAATGALANSFTVGSAVSALGGIGAGYGLGSLAGGFIQSGLGKVGPAPQIGAGAGALAGAAIGTIFPVIGNIVGAIVGGLIGGAGGGFIGPKAPSPFSQTNVAASGGRLYVGDTLSQDVNTDQQVQQVTAEVNQLNQVLANTNTLIDSLGGITQVGQNTPGGFQDPSKTGDLYSAFSQFRFSSPDSQLNAALSGKSFANISDFNDFVNGLSTLVNTTIPQLTANLAPTTTAVDQFNTQLDQVNQTYNDAIAQAQKYGIATDRLTEAQTKAVSDMTDAFNAQQKIANSVTLSHPNEANAGGNVASTLTNFLGSLLSSTLSPLGAYQNASSQFDKLAQAAMSGDFTAIAGLQGSAQTFLTASKGVYGSGAGYVSDVSRVVNAITPFANMTPDAVTNAVLITETRTQTDVLQGSLNDLLDMLTAIRAAIVGNNNMPVRLAG